MACRKISGPIVGESEQIRMLLTIIARIAPHDVSVLVLGETGSGKELVAKEIHKQSKRSGGPVVAFNCSAIPSALLEAELFGWELGAFTGAVKARRGLFEQANGGTLILDEIGEMELSMQAKLLRVLEDRRVTRLGSSVAAEPTPIDVRIIAITRRDLEVEITAGRFRDDLFYRLAGYKIRVPPLRERRDDAVRIGEHFVREFAPGTRLTRQARPLLEAYNWPGNVRELRSLIQAATIDAKGKPIRACHLLGHLPESVAREVQATASRSIRIGDYLREHGASSAKDLAAGLGIPKSTLHAVLGRMVDDDLVEVLGKGRSTRFAIPRAKGARDALSARQQAGLEFINEAEGATRSEYAKQFNVSLSTASRDLGELVELSLVGRGSGQGRSGRYLVLPQGRKG